MREPSFLRRVVLVGALVLSATGLSATVGSVQAMPVAPALSGAADLGDMTDVQYIYPRRYRRAGPYNCGRNELRTHLERRACGRNGVGRNGRYR